MKYSASLFLVASLVTTVQGFVVLPTSADVIALNADAFEEDDFDAPADRVIAAGNAVKSPKKTDIGFGLLPKFLADAFGAKKVVDDVDFIMDEECYLGKDGDLDECADFDPPSTP